jgi:hypothetical protein
MVDGLDEGGDAYEDLEKYVSCRLSVEVMLIVTSREKGLKLPKLFRFFAKRQMASLDQQQLQQLSDQGRGFGAALAEYIEQQQQKDEFMRLITSPSSSNTPAVSYAAMAAKPLMFELMALDFTACRRRGEPFKPPSTAAGVYSRGIEQIMQTEAAAHMCVCFKLGKHVGTAGRFVKYSEDMEV